MKTTVRAILMNRHQQFLFVQHSERNPADLGRWSTVGGHIETTESHQHCLHRELLEEFGPSLQGKIQIGDLLFESKQPNRVDHFYAVNLDVDDVSIAAHDEILCHKGCSPAKAKHLNLFFGFEADLCEQYLLKNHL